MSIFTSLLTAGTNSHQETSENANAVATDFVSQGVIGAITNTSGVAPSTGAFAVNAQGTPNMTVAVSSGVAYVTATPTSQNSQTFRVRNTASVNVTISANSSGSTKYDWIYLQIDATKAANPAVDASDVATLVVSRSSSSTADNGTPPTYGYNLAVVTVANAASSITNGNIADKRTLASSSPANTLLPNSLLSGTGTSWAWQSWTPSWTNVTVGNGTVTAQYAQIGKTVFIRLYFTLGSTSSISGTVSVSLPVTANSTYTTNNYDIGPVVLVETGTDSYQGTLQINNTTTVRPLNLHVMGSLIDRQNVNATTPFTWGNTHVLSLTGAYEAA
jgi:hypothetical protein